MKSPIIFLFVLIQFNVYAQSFQANYDEQKVPDYTLPDPLILENGKAVVTRKMWYEQRRPEILKLFSEHVYGKAPEKPQKMSYELLAIKQDALNGKATQKQVRVHFQQQKTHKMDILVYVPNAQTKPVPLFVGLNFYGNHTVHPDSDILITDRWVRNNAEFGITDNKATKESRGIRKSRWPVERIIERGYALATIYYGDLDPDYDDGFQNGIHPLFYKTDQNKPKPDEWAAIAAWAWGLERSVDYFELDNDIDETKVAVMGHSRLGKTSLWAGANDERFAVVISNDSGCGGAALSRRRFGETVKRINTVFPHWFCDNFTLYDDNEEQLPVDQHMLIASIAPRPVYIASAQEDLWADPRGEFLSAKHAGSVYAFLGKKGLATGSMPAVNTPIHNTIGYHVRSGKHDVKMFDWERFMDFTDMHLKDNNE